MMQSTLFIPIGFSFFSTQAFTGRESFSSNVMGADIYVFGGCLLYESCYNDMIVYDTGVACPNDCNDNGVCRNDRCVCSQGYYGFYLFGSLH